MEFKHRHLLGLEGLSADEIGLILETAVPFKEMFTRSIKKTPALRGKTVVNLFYEPSTRTRISFELAEKRLSADVINVQTSTSSVVKGESLIDTVKTLQAMKADIIVIRHSCAGVPLFLSERVQASIVNAGDGRHEHPTQGLLDLFTIKEKKGRIKGLKVVIVGDIGNSRVARSNIWGLLKLGAEVRLVGPSTLVSSLFERFGVRVYNDLAEAVRDADVINILRIQLERMKQKLFPSIREYNHLYGIDEKRLKDVNPDVMIMHPGPMNRGIEISDLVADGANAVITEQVTNGIAVRMAVLYLLAGNLAPAVEE
jgi:aspartate carbamoyltransferase catalytic subunit